MMKKVFGLLAGVILCLLSACSMQQKRVDPWYSDNGKVKVLSTIAMIDDIVQYIGGDEVETLVLIRGELDPHSYELVKGDDEKFARADLIFYNGLGLEHQFSLRRNLENNPKAVAVADTILQKTPRDILQVDQQYDPHVWMDISLWIRTLEPITQALARKDPTHAELFCHRREELARDMRETDEKVFRTLQSIPATKRYLVTSHDAFHYFTRHYLAEPGEQDWQKRCRAPEGLAPEAQLSINDIIEIIAHIKQYNISVIFPESNVSQDALHKIVHAGKQKGCTIRLCKESLYSDSMGLASSYLDMIVHNVEIIARELTRQPE